MVLSDPQFNQLSWRETSILQNELTKVLKSYLNEYDMVSSNNPGDYYFLMNETDMEKAEELKEMLIFNLEYLVKSNVEGSQVKVEVELEEIKNRSSAKII